jgi:outer membrane receptor protein involved in Fe transport
MSAQIDSTLSPAATLPADTTAIKEISLNEATITTKRQAIVRKADRLVLNVDALASGGNIEDALRKIPGITIDNDANIALKGKKGLLVMINDKPTYMSPEALKNYIKNTPLSNIDKIEVLSSPSAKYDAEGTAGILNIKVKRNKNEGFNGDVHSMYSQGVYARNSIGTNLNLNIPQWTLFGNYDYGIASSFQNINQYAQFKTLDKAQLLNSDTWQKYHFKYHSLNMGADYAFNEKNTVGLLINGFAQTFGHHQNNETQLTNQLNELELNNTTNSDFNQFYQSFFLNVHFKHKIDTLGSEYSLDVDAADFADNQFQNYKTAFLRPILTDILQKSDAPSQIQNKALKFDYLKTLKNDAKLEMGLKVSNTMTDNSINYKVFNLIAQAYESDSNRTNQFSYQEKNYAAYINWNKSYKKIELQIGLRGEYTQARGISMHTINSVSQEYFKLFPSLFIQYNAHTNHQMGFAYSKRIERPRYDNLNPFETYLSPYFSNKGNPFLQPSFTNNYEMTYTFKSKYIFALNYAFIEHSISEISEQNYKTQQTTYGFANIDRYHSWNVSSTIPMAPFPFWTIDNTWSCYSQTYQSKYLSHEFKASKIVVDAQMVHNLKLTPKIQAELALTYTTPSIQGIYQVRRQWIVDASIVIKMLNEKGKLKIDFSDLFYTNQGRVIIDLFDQHAGFVNYNDSRKIRLNFTYKFGGNYTPTKRKTSNEEERNRAAK